ncbi:MAG: rhodanese-like domain-containing protein [Acidobacteriota bacterium]|nr:rhodanese-like domain-containing protein [Acidobacteriota bacterium]
MIPFAALALFMVLFAAPQCRAQFSSGEASSASALSISQAQLIQPEALNRLLQAAEAGRPLVLQVGSHVMFAEAHIPGSIYAGPGSQSDGLQLLASKVASTPKNKFIVIYCGCCPWSHCPNIGPAFKRLHDLGFTNVKALYIANNFGADWVSKGYRVDHGQ